MRKRPCASVIAVAGESDAWGSMAATSAPATGLPPSLTAPSMLPVAPAALAPIARNIGSATNCTRMRARYHRIPSVLRYAIDAPDDRVDKWPEPSSRCRPIAVARRSTLIVPLVLSAAGHLLVLGLLLYGAQLSWPAPPIPIEVRPAHRAVQRTGPIEQRGAARVPEPPTRPRPGAGEKRAKPPPPRTLPPPETTDLSPFAPDDAHLVVLLRMDKLRRSPHRAGAEALLAALPDWSTLVAGSGVSPLDDFEALLIATADPREVTATFLAARYRDSPQQRALVERPLPAGDPRIFKIVQPGLTVLTQPNTLATDMGDSRATWLAQLAAFDRVAQADNGPALLVTLSDAPALLHFGSGLPTPQAMALAATAESSPAVRVRLLFADAGEAQAFARAWPDDPLPLSRGDGAARAGARARRPGARGCGCEGRADRPPAGGAAAPRAQLGARADSTSADAARRERDAAVVSRRGPCCSRAARSVDHQRPDLRLLRHPHRLGVGGARLRGADPGAVLAARRYGGEVGRALGAHPVPDAAALSALSRDPAAQLRRDHAVLRHRGLRRRRCRPGTFARRVEAVRRHAPGAATAGASAIGWRSYRTSTTICSPIPSGSCRRRSPAW